MQVQDLCQLLDALPVRVQRRWRRLSLAQKSGQTPRRRQRPRASWRRGHTTVPLQRLLRLLAVRWLRARVLRRFQAKWPRSATQ